MDNIPPYPYVIRNFAIYLEMPLEFIEKLYNILDFNDVNSINKDEIKRVLDEYGINLCTIALINPEPPKSSYEPNYLMIIRHYDFIHVKPTKFYYSLNFIELGVDFRNIPINMSKEFREKYGYKPPEPDSTVIGLYITPYYRIWKYHKDDNIHVAIEINGEFYKVTGEQLYKLEQFTTNNNIILDELLLLTMST